MKVAFWREQHQPLWFQENDLSIFCWKQLLENVSCITELSLPQHLQKFGLQSLSNHFKLVLIKKNTLSWPNWCYRYNFASLSLLELECSVFDTHCRRLPDDCLTTAYLKSSEESGIGFKSWNRLALKVETEQGTYWQTAQTKAYNEQG